MLTCATGALEEGLYLLTFGQSCFYLVGSSGDYTLIDCGLSVHVRGLEQRLADLGVSFSEIRQLLFTNISAARAGGVYELAKRLPHLQICANGAMRRLLEEQDQLVASNQSFSSLFSSNSCSLSSDPSTIDPGLCEGTNNLSQVRLHTIADAGILELADGQTAQVFSAVGYSLTSTAYFLPRYRALLCDQGLGYHCGRHPVAPGADEAASAALSTLSKIADFDVQYLLLPYCGALSGNRVRKFLAESREILEHLPSEIARARSEGIQVGDCIDQITKHYYSPEISDPLFKSVLEASRQKFLSQTGLREA